MWFQANDLKKYLLPVKIHIYYNGDNIINEFFASPGIKVFMYDLWYLMFSQAFFQGVFEIG